VLGRHRTRGHDEAGCHQEKRHKGGAHVGVRGWPKS
jgi:hypothetical protein